MGLFSMFGGGSDQASAATDAGSLLANYAQQASDAEVSQLRQALDLQGKQFNFSNSDLRQMYGQGRADLEPYKLGGLNAYDAYMETLGLPVAVGGSAALSGNYAIGSALDDEISRIKEGYGSIAASERPVVDPAKSITDNQRRMLSGYVGNGTSNDLLSKITGQANVVNNTNYANMTPEQLDQAFLTLKRNDPKFAQLVREQNGLSLSEFNAGNKRIAEIQNNPAYQAYQKVKWGATPTQVASSSSVLGKFLNTPEYQLQFGNTGAAVDPTASVLDRFQTSPGYQFQLDQGQKALEKSMASRGLLESGSFAQEMNKFGQGVANQEFNNYLNRVTGTFQNYQNNLLNLANGGQQASSQLSNTAMNQGATSANVRSNYANSSAMTYGNIGSALASGLLAQGGALAGGMMNAANINAANSQANSQMGSMLGGVLGRAAGSYFGGPVGGGIGSALGSAIGGGLF